MAYNGLEPSFGHGFSIKISDFIFIFWVIPRGTQRLLLAQYSEVLPAVLRVPGGARDQTYAFHMHSACAQFFEPSISLTLKINILIKIAPPHYTKESIFLHRSPLDPFNHSSIHTLATWILGSESKGLCLLDFVS